MDQGKKGEGRKREKKGITRKDMPHHCLTSVVKKPGPYFWTPESSTFAACPHHSKKSFSSVRKF